MYYSKAVARPNTKGAHLMISTLYNGWNWSSPRPKRCLVPCQPQFTPACKQTRADGTRPGSSRSSHTRSPRHDALKSTSRPRLKGPRQVIVEPEGRRGGLSALGSTSRHVGAHTCQRKPSFNELEELQEAEPAAHVTRWAVAPSVWHKESFERGSACFQKAKTQGSWP